MPLNLILISSGRLIHSSLPNEYSGKHWLEDTDTLRHPRRLASIEAKDNTWILRPYASTTLIRKDPETAQQLRCLSARLPHHQQDRTAAGMEPPGAR